MRVIIAGGRGFNDMTVLSYVITEAKFNITEVVSGASGVDKDDYERHRIMCKGADLLGEVWANNQTPRIPVVRFYAAFRRNGLKAGPQRNAAMARYADALIALPGGKGTTSMINEAKAAGITTFVVRA